MSEVVSVSKEDSVGEEVVVESADIKKVKVVGRPSHKNLNINK